MATFLRKLSALVAVGLFFAGSLAFASERPDLEIELRLFDALFRGDAPSADTGSLIMLLRRYGERWDRGWGVARDISVWVVEARVEQAQYSEQQLDFSLEVRLEDGWAQYRVKVTRGDDAVYRGAFEGAVRGWPVKGKADARVLPQHRQPKAGFTQVEPGEHPRILFRRSDLPRLKERLKTAMGQAAFAKLSGPIGLGIRYQLTGDKQYAEQTTSLVEELMAKGHHCDQYGNNLGDRLEKTALAYDMCSEAWPGEFRKKVEDYMVWGANCTFRGRRDMGGGINWNIVSNWSAPLYAGAAFAGLALWGEKGPEPPKPAETNCGIEVAPADGYAPGKGVPVSAFANDKMPEEWIYVAGFKVGAGQDALAGLGGAAKARPEVATRVEFAGRSEEFRPISKEKDKGYYTPTTKDGKPEPKVIDLTNASNKVTLSTGYYYTVIRNDKARWVRLWTGAGKATAYLAGVALREGDCVGLKPGAYPLLIEAAIDWTVSWGRQTMQPRLAEVSEEQARTVTARRRAEYEAAVRDWQYDHAEWKRTGGQNVAYGKLYERGRHDMYVFCREAVGTGGFQGEVSHYSQIATRPPMRYDTAHCGMFGYDVSPLHDITEVVPRKMFVHLFRPEGRAVAQEINGYPELDCGFFAIAFPVLREEWKPAVLWAWNYTALAGGKSKDPAVASAEADPVHTFLNYPLDMQPKPPAGIMPLTWRADEFGFYGFRNAWEGKDEFIVQVFLKAHTIGGWNGPNAGTFRVLGLGHIWAWGTRDRNRCRWEESVVMLPEDTGINQSACAILTHIATQPDGSGVLTMDFRDVYATAATDAGGRRARIYERYGNIRKDEGFKDSGIAGLRSLAVDYSGKSGAPCLLAIVDHITGGKKKIWTWQLVPPSRGDRKSPADAGDLGRTKVEGNTFTITKPDGATLAGVFATRHEVKAELRNMSMTGGAGSSAGKTLSRPIYGVFAEGGGDFFVVITIQRGPAPAVKVDGEGLSAKVTVGKQTVRFDGQKIVLQAAE